MHVPVVFDLTCYPGYFLKQTPTGIGRIDMAYGQYLLRSPERLAAGLRLAWTGPALSSVATVQALHDAVSAHWSQPPGDPVGAQVLEWLTRDATLRHRISAPRGYILGKAVAVSRLACHWPRRDRALVIPQNAVYLNISYPMLRHPSYFRWLTKRPDVRAVFMVHDLIAIDYPEYFRQGEKTVFQKEIGTILTFAHHVITPSDSVRDRLLRYAASQGRRDLRVSTIPFPPPPAFLVPVQQDAALRDVPYFVICGTIEPRKNHLLLLNVWREMIRSGQRPPKLVVIGKRGWENEQVLDMLERCEELRGYVIEVSDLQTDSLRHVIANARALLMPSFAEGFGLPVVEALALGTPVIASDIPVFREVADGCATFISPIDGPGWQDAIMGLTNDPDRLARSRRQAQDFEPRSWDDYFAALDRTLTEEDAPVRDGAAHNVAKIAGAHPPL